MSNKCDNILLWLSDHCLTLIPPMQSRDAITSKKHGPIHFGIIVNIPVSKRMSHHTLNIDQDFVSWSPDSYAVEMVFWQWMTVRSLNNQGSSDFDHLNPMFRLSMFLRRKLDRCNLQLDETQMQSHPGTPKCNELQIHLPGILCGHWSDH